MIVFRCHGLQDSDEENRGVHANLLTTSVSSTVSFTTKNTISGSGLFDNNQSRPSNITATISGAPVAVESQRIVSEAIDGKLSAAPGGFTFPASNPFGTSLDAPPTPKPFPSPSNTGPPAKSNGVPAYKFNTGSSGDNMFKLPVSHNADDASKANHQRDSTSGFTPRYSPWCWEPPPILVKILVSIKPASILQHFYLWLTAENISQVFRTVSCVQWCVCARDSELN